MRRISIWKAADKLVQAGMMLGFGASEDHVEILMQGRDAWNEWRKNHRTLRPRLSGLISNGMNLAGMNLAGAEIIHAHLVAADLRQADLRAADLSFCDLQEADLRKADLTAANLCNANLSGANFRNCTMGLTVFGDIDLSSTRGLDRILHLAPSIFSMGTIYRSGGQISETFLRGAGVPENLIKYMNSLVGKPFEYYSCFISYSSRNQEFATRLHADLQSRGVRCWFAPEDLRIGDKLRSSFDEAIRLHDKLLVVLSDSSVKSPWVEKEIETAFEKERQQNRTVLFPVRLDDAVMKTTEAWAADIRRTRHIGDFRKWKDHDSYKKAFDHLLRDLKAESVTKSAKQE